GINITGDIDSVFGLKVLYCTNVLRRTDIMKGLGELCLATGQSWGVFFRQRTEMGVFEIHGGRFDQIAIAFLPGPSYPAIECFYIQTIVSREVVEFLDINRLFRGFTRSSHLDPVKCENRFAAIVKGRRENLDTVTKSQTSRMEDRTASD